MIIRKTTADGITIEVKMVGYGSYILSCDDPDYLSSVRCDDSFIYDYLTDEDYPERQEAAVAEALRRLYPF